MIKTAIPLSMAESIEYITGESDRETETKKFIKKFTKVDSTEGKKIRKQVEALNLIKVKAEHIAKVIDVMPDDMESLNKIFSDVSLDEDEAKKILDTIKEFK